MRNIKGYKDWNNVKFDTMTIKGWQRNSSNSELWEKYYQWQKHQTY